MHVCFGDQRSTSVSSPATLYLIFVRQGLTLCLALTKSGYPRWLEISSDWSISASPVLRLKACGATVLAKMLQVTISSCVHTKH